jgi:amidohydrolase family protein
MATSARLKLGRCAWSMLTFALAFSLVSQPGDVTFLQTTTASPNNQTYQFINGQWFNGQSFRRSTFYSVEGVLTQHRPPVVNAIIDLADGFVVPPFAEAHNHNVERAWDIETRIQHYLKDGVFYVKNPNNIARFSKQILNKLNAPGTIDVVFANGGLTASGGHPISLYEDILSKSRYANAIGNISKGWFNNEAYFIIDNEMDLQTKWAAIKAEKPDLLKTFLGYSEDFEKYRHNPSPDVRTGLAPKLLPIIVEKAHKDGLRVSTHVETATDFHNALVAGVDEINHLPGFDILSPDQIYRYQISEQDAQLAVRRGLFVVTTTVLSKSMLRDQKLLPLVRENQERNLRLLHQYGVNIAIGSDHGDTALDEALNLYELKVFDNLTLLKLWCEITPLTIFPKRKIGQLKEGYEASFLVLAGDPIADFSRVREIRMRFKQGQPIDLPR